jgi:hypothetical protein
MRINTLIRKIDLVKMEERKTSPKKKAPEARRLLQLRVFASPDYNMGEITLAASDVATLYRPPWISF